MVRFEDFREDDEGQDGYYVYLGDGLGAKVLKRGSLATAQQEYLFNLYVQNHPDTENMTSEVLACGTAMIQLRGKWSSRPVIWMRHIDGMNVYEYAVSLGLALDPSLTRADALTQGYACERFAPVIYQMCEIEKALLGIGYSCWDHSTDPGNYMLTPQGAVYAIDFKPQKMYGRIKEKPGLLQTIYDQHGEALSRTIPQEYLPTLVALGLLVVD